MEKLARFLPGFLPGFWLLNHSNQRRAWRAERSSVDRIMLRRVITDAARRAAGSSSTADSVAARWVSSALCATSGEGASSTIRQPSSLATWVRHKHGRLNSKGSRPIGVPVAPTPYFGNMIVERLPMVAPPPEPWEAEYQQWSDERRRKFLKKLPEGLVNPKAVSYTHLTLPTTPYV